MKTDAARSRAVVEVSRNSLGDLLLQIAQISPLSRDPAGAIRSVPGCHEPAGFLVTLDLKRNFVHHFNPSPTLGARSSPQTHDPRNADLKRVTFCPNINLR